MTLPWPKVRIDSIGEVQAGRQRSASIVTGTLRPYLRVANVFDGFIDYSDILQMPFTDAEFQTYVLKTGDILVNEGQSLELVGRSAVYEGPQDTYCFQNTLVRFRPSETIDPHFAQLIFQHMLATGVFASIASRTTSIAHLGVERFASLHISLPPLEEQQAISRIGGVWNRGIKLLSDLIAAKLRLKQGLTQQLLAGKRRLTTDEHTTGPAMQHLPFADSIASLEVEFGITGTSFQQGIPSLNSCPTGWKTHQLREILEVVERPAQLNDADTYQLVTAKRYRGGIVPRERMRGDRIKTKTQFYVASGDFLISRRQIIHGACGIVPESLDGAIVSNEYACLQPRGGLDPHFLRYISHSVYFQQTCYHASVGVALEKMIFRLDKWLGNRIHLPPLSEQRRIARCLAALEHEILLLARQRQILKSQKKGLMQKLLTGQVRVKP